MIEVAICDNDIAVTADIEKKLQIISEKQKVKIEIDIFFEGVALENYIVQGKRYDLIYLDTKMHKKNGIEIARNIRKYDKNVLLIFISNCESFSKETFEVSAFRVMKKPIERNIFERYFNDAQKIILTPSKNFRYQYKKIIYRIPIDKIIFFQSDCRLTYIITESETQQCYLKLNTIEEKLIDNDQLFCRIHQSFLINPQYVAKYMYDSVEMIGGTVLNISEKRRRSVKQFWNQFIGGEIIV